MLKEGNAIPDGNDDRIDSIRANDTSPTVGPTLAEQFADVIGAVPDLPPDMAEQHDHYLHGAPKR